MCPSQKQKPARERVFKTTSGLAGSLAADVLASLGVELRSRHLLERSLLDFLWSVEVTSCRLWTASESFRVIARFNHGSSLCRGRVHMVSEHGFVTILSIRYPARRWKRTRRTGVQLSTQSSGIAGFSVGMVCCWRGNIVSIHSDFTRYIADACHVDTPIKQLQPLNNPEPPGTAGLSASYLAEKVAVTRCRSSTTASSRYKNSAKQLIITNSSACVFRNRSVREALGRPGGHAASVSHWWPAGKHGPASPAAKMPERWSGWQSLWVPLGHDVCRFSMASCPGEMSVFRGVADGDQNNGLVPGLSGAVARCAMRIPVTPLASPSTSSRVWCVAGTILPPPSPWLVHCRNRFGTELVAAVRR